MNANELSALLKEVHKNPADPEKYDGGKHATLIFQDGEVSSTKGGRIFAQRGLHLRSEAFLLAPLPDVVWPLSLNTYPCVCVDNEEDVKRVIDSMKELAKELEVTVMDEATASRLNLLSTQILGLSQRLVSLIQDLKEAKQWTDQSNERRRLVLLEEISSYNDHLLRVQKDLNADNLSNWKKNSTSEYINFQLMLYFEQTSTFFYQLLRKRSEQTD